MERTSCEQASKLRWISETERSQAKKDRGDGELIRRWRCAGDGIVLLQRGNKCEPVHSVVAALMTTQQQQPKGERGKGSMFANWWGWLVVTWSAKGHALPTPPLLRTLSRTSNALSFTRAPQPPRTTSRGKGLLLLLLRLLQSPPHTLLLRTSHPRLLFPRSPTCPRALVLLPKHHRKTEENLP